MNFNQTWKKDNLLCFIYNYINKMKELTQRIQKNEIPTANENVLFERCFNVQKSYFD